MVRPTYVDKKGMKKGAWSEEEDRKLSDYVQRYGHWNWRLLPKYAGLERCGKSCRLRWVNYLKPGTKHGNFSEYEVDLIIQLHIRLANRWSAIAAELPGRTDNEIKNFWHTYIKKRRGGKRDVDAMQPESMIKEKINGKADQVLVFDEEDQSPYPNNPINTTPHVLNESNHLKFSNSTTDVLLPHDLNSWGYFAQSSDNLSADSNSPASVAQSTYNLWVDSNSPASVEQSSYNLWVDSNSLIDDKTHHPVSVFDEEDQLTYPSNPINTTPQIFNESNYIDFSSNTVLVRHDSISPASIAQLSNHSWFELYPDDTSYNQNVYDNLPPLVEEEIFSSGLIQEHHYIGECFSIFDYSVPASFDGRNQTDDVLDTSQSELIYFASQVEAAGEVSDQCFLYLDHDMGLF